MTSESKTEPTRRDLLTLIGGSLGVHATYSAMTAMGLITLPKAYAGAPELPANLGVGQNVAILGAGTAGMTAAYELAKAGYQCHILEATDRAGGRNITYRKGDVALEARGSQRIDFDDHPEMYFNAGPARIPYHHQGILSYCREFGVVMEPLINLNRGAYFFDQSTFGDAPIRNRQLSNDARGIVAELLTKAVSKGSLDVELGTHDHEELLDFLTQFGRLDRSGTYMGTSRSGYQQSPGARLNAPGDPMNPLDLGSILKSPLWHYKLDFAEGFTQAPTMMQPRGGMDMIAKAFRERVGSMIRFDAVVKQIRRHGEKALIVYEGKARGEETIVVDHVICTIPFSVLSNIEADFSSEVLRAIRTCSYSKAAKAGLQFRKRFWELDDHIYGGISWLEEDITQIWYPSSGFGLEKGVLTGAYIWNDSLGETFGEMSFSSRLEKVLAEGAKLHPIYPENFTSGVSIAWEHVPHQQGAWARWSDDEREDIYPVVTKPDGPFHFAGEHISYLTGWQEGAVLSAHDAVRAIAEV